MRLAVSESSVKRRHVCLCCQHLLRLMTANKWRSWGSLMSQSEMDATVWPSVHQANTFSCLNEASSSRLSVPIKQPAWNQRKCLCVLLCQCKGACDQVNPLGAWSDQLNWITKNNLLWTIKSTPNKKCIYIFRFYNVTNTMWYEEKSP